jgi:serine/threonine-protein kinase HipA
MLSVRKRFVACQATATAWIDGSLGWRGPRHEPVAHGDGLTLNISETDNAQDLELVLAVAKRFRVKAVRAKEIVGEIQTAVGQ